MDAKTKAECVALEQACVAAVEPLLGRVTLSESGLRELRGVCEQAMLMVALIPNALQRYEIHLEQHFHEPTALCVAVSPRKDEPRTN